MVWRASVAKSDSPLLKTKPIGRHYIAAVLAGGAYLVISLSSERSLLLEGVEQGTRSALYISLATTCAALLGFAITSVTILLALGGGRRVDWLYKTEGFRYVRTIFLGAINALAVATLYFTALIVVDTAKSGSGYWEAIGAAIVVLVILRICRIVRLLSDLLAIAIADRSKTDGDNPPFTQSVNEDDDENN
jgi:hypothetical protein